MNSNMELANEVVDFRHRVLWNLVLQCAQGSIDIIEAPIQLVLDIREAKNGIKREADGGKELANRFAMTSNSFWPSAFAKALVPNRACRPGSEVDQGRVVVKKWRSFSLAFLGVIRAWRSVVLGCLTQNHPCLNISVRFRSIPSHFPSSPEPMRSGLVKTGMVRSPDGSNWRTK